MADEIKRRCVIISGSPECDPEFLRKEVGEGDFVICADLGYDHARRAGITPSLLAGDFDSCGGELPEDIEIIRLKPEKDFSDTLHCVFEALERGYSEIALLNALGGRTDHTLSNLYALEYIRERGANAVILSATEEIRLLKNESIRLSGVLGLTFSLFPFGCESAVVSYKGAKYPLDRGELRSSLPIGLSNEFVSDEAEIEVHSGKAILLIDRLP